MTTEIKIGDKIIFRAATRWSFEKAARKVNGFYCGQPTVRYSGCKHFVVRPSEISAVVPA